MKSVDSVKATNALMAYKSSAVNKKSKLESVDQGTPLDLGIKITISNEGNS